MPDKTETELLEALRGYARAAAHLPPQDPSAPGQYGVSGEPLLAALRAFVDARLDAARRDEREACAQVAEADLLARPGGLVAAVDRFDSGISEETARRIAGAIRARGGTP